MTDRVKGFTVVLERDIRIDDVEVIKTAIEMIRGVGSVEMHITTHEDHISRMQMKDEIRTKLFDFIKAEL